jgi:hypothetical protein
MTAINSNRAIRGPVTAVPVVAGKGVRLVADTENNRWVVEADETVLWSGDFKYGDSAITLSETIANFEFIEVALKASYQLYRRQAENGSFVLINGIVANDAKAKVAYITLNASGSSVTYTQNRVMQGDSSYSNVSDDETHIIKIVGIHRIASA